MLTFSQFLAEQYLEEKLIMYNQGKRYGQIVFLAGGAASGKGFAIRNFMEKEKFKVRDVDAWKTAFMTLGACLAFTSLNNKSRDFSLIPFSFTN